MDDVLKKNPELARQMAAAAAAQAGPGFGNFMGMAMGVQPPMPQGPSYSGNGGPSGNVGPQPPPSQTGGFFGASAAPPMSEASQGQPQRSSARREMAGPTGGEVDDILRAFDNARRAEAAATFQTATGVLTQPAVAAAMSSSMSVAESHADSAQTGATGTLRPRRKRAQPPVGNTVSLDA